MPDKIEQIKRLEAEIERLQNKNREYHRRVQQAEAAVPHWNELLEIVKANRQGVTSFSRLLMASALYQAKEENEKLKAALHVKNEEVVQSVSEIEP